MIDLPPQLDAEVVSCIAAASAHYNSDPQVTIDRILERRGVSGETRTVQGGKELGIYGIPEHALVQLAPAGLAASKVRDDDCLNVSVGIYLMSMQANAISTRANTSMTVSTSPPQPATNRRRLPRMDAQDEQCVVDAAIAYELPEHVFRAVLRTEGGWAGLKKRNTNGSYDMGPAQINTIHLPELSKHGITESMLVHDACINIFVGAYRLRVEIERVGDLWRGVGNYHSRTPHLHKAYLSRVQGNL